MKRGLKELIKDLVNLCYPVTTVTPMKRGLKANTEPSLFNQSGGYNRYPDEKGTERQIKELPDIDSDRVTTVTPMKRGLKGQRTLY